MAHAFLEPDFLLRRATPTPARTQAPATSRPAFSIPEPDRAQVRPQDIRARTARAPAPFVQGAAAPNTLPRDTGAPSPRPRDGRTDEVRPERDHPDVPVRSERPSAPERTVRDGPTSTRSGTAPTDADASGKVASGKAASSKTGTEVTGAVRDSAAAAPAGATGSPEAAMAAAVNADAGTTLEAGSAEEPVTGGMEEDGEAGEISTEDPEASLLSSGFLPPPPPPTSPVRHGASDSTAEGEASGTSIPSSSGPGHPPAGALKPSQGDVPGVADEAGPGKADPAVAVRDAKATAAEIALPDGMPRVRESFDSLLPAASAAPAAAPTQTTSVSVTQPSPAAAPPVPLGAVPMTIGLRSLQGSNHFEIRLDPGELGRIDVSLDIDKERGTVMAHLVVDRVETLALLQRDTGSLQQALSQAGLDASEANINVSLRSDTQSGGRGADGQGADGRHPGGRPGGPGLPGQPEGRAALAPVPMRTLRGLTGLDIRI